MNGRTLWAISGLLAIVTLPVGIYKIYQDWQVRKYGVIVEGTVVSFPWKDEVGISLQGKTYEMQVGDDSRADFHVGDKVRMRFLPGKEPLFEKQDPLVWGAIWLSLTLLWAIVSVWKFRKKDPRRRKDLGVGHFVIN